jgi:hypothetical protein
MDNNQMRQITLLLLLLLLLLPLLVGFSALGTVPTRGT